ncbi:hypothetical protein C8R44DRAFT_749907 [Mycena epipterygia]|nr:hypothetical protein C8R44DRAFT_749907 [Mycena epipterygia]
MPPLHHRRGNAPKSHDFGSAWPRILYPWDFEVADGCFGLAQGFWICEMPAKVVILAQFGHEYYIHGTLERLTDVGAWLKAFWICAWWICFGHGYYIRGTLKRLTDAVALLKAWWICLDHGYYIRETLKRLTNVVGRLKAWWIHLKASWICTRNPCHRCLAGEEMPAKVVISAQFGHGYYIRGTLKRPTDVVVWLHAFWICVFWLGSGLHGSKVLNTWCSCLEFYTIFASKSPALR